jgi:hypothetical protein
MTCSLNINCGKSNSVRAEGCLESYQHLFGRPGPCLGSRLVQAWGRHCHIQSCLPFLWSRIKSVAMSVYSLDQRYCIKHVTQFISSLLNMKSHCPSRLTLWVLCFCCEEKLEWNCESGDSSSKECYRNYGGACGGVCRSLRLAEV